MQALARLYASRAAVQRRAAKPAAGKKVPVKASLFKRVLEEEAVAPKGGPPRAEVLALFRRLLRAATRLKYTNTLWYKKQIREHFEKHRYRKDVTLQLERGRWLLENGLGGLL